MKLADTYDPHQCLTLFVVFCRFVSPPVVHVAAVQVVPLPFAALPPLVPLSQTK
jgi:hypothetical protein